MKKRVYVKPTLFSEAFISQEYVAVCEPGKWEPDENAPILPSFHGHPDLNRNGILDPNEEKIEWTSDGSLHGSLPDVEPCYIWNRDTGERCVFWPIKEVGNGKFHGVGYAESYVNKNVS